jgi:site-specific recombinase
MILTEEILKEPATNFYGDSVLAQLQNEVDKLAHHVESVAEQQWQQQYAALRDQLKFQAERINSLSAELEQELLKIIDLIPRVEQTYRSWQRLLTQQATNNAEPARHHSKFQKIFKVKNWTIPRVVAQESAVVLEAKEIDLSQTAFVAQKFIPPGNALCSQNRRHPTTELMANKLPKVPVVSSSVKRNLPRTL